MKRFNALLRPPQTYASVYVRVRQILIIQAWSAVKIRLYDDQASLDTVLPPARRGTPALFLEKPDEIWLALDQTKPRMLAHEFAHLLLRNHRPMSREAEELEAQRVDAEFI